MRVVLQPETEQAVLNWSKLTLITLILEKNNRTTLIKICYNLLFAHCMMSRLSCRVGIGGIRELLDGKIWEWDLSFRWKWEWEWSHWNGRELVRKICSRTPLLGSQPAGDVNHKFSGRLPWLSARPAVIPATLKEGCYQFRCLVNRGTMGVNSLHKTIMLPDSVATAIWTFCVWFKHANHSATEPHQDRLN